jgi:phospholipid/cholesterol/gamma-HCH transport system substrate-binding protein
LKTSLRSALWRFTAFAMVCVAGTFALLMVFAKLRFQGEQTYRAEFSNVGGLKEGDLVRIAGVEVGKVKRIWITEKATPMVQFSADDSVVLTRGTRASIRWADPFGGRFLGLEEGAGSTTRLAPEATIPMAQTQPALDLDSLVGGFRPLFRALDPKEVNDLSNQLIMAFQGQGATISSFLSQAALVTGTLADRDELIGQVVNNLNTLVGSLGDQSDQFAKGVDSLSKLLGDLSKGRSAITNAVAYTNESAATLADLLSRSRPAVKDAVAQSDRAAAIVVADHDYFDDLLNTLPDTYRMLARQGLYGDFFSFYLCDLMLKVNGKGGQPVYVDVVSQKSGRCTPR